MFVDYSLPVYVFDVDGVLIDVNEKIREALKRIGLPEEYPLNNIDPRRKQLFWKYFLSEELIVYDKPRPAGIKLLLDRLEKGQVLVVSGRPENLKKATLKELKIYGVPINKIVPIFRRRGDRRPFTEFKLEIFKSIPNIVEVHDDMIDVLYAVKRIKPRVKTYLHKGDEFFEI